jgi:hypothetical protein
MANKLSKAVVAEVKGSAPLTRKRAFGRDLEAGASTSQPHNESLKDHRDNTL